MVKVRYSDGPMSAVVRGGSSTFELLKLSSIHRFEWIIINLCQNVCLNEIQVKLKSSRSHELKKEKILLTL